MIRNIYLSTAAIYAHALLTIFLASSLFAEDRPAQKPNILWIIAEDLSPFMGCYGDAVNSDHTPVIDAFAKEGVLFTRAYTTSPVCSSSRSAFITGVFANYIEAHNHRSSRAPENVIVPKEHRINLPQNFKTIPELMREAGYFTFNSGKDDYNFHYNRRELYHIGTKSSYQPGMNGWQGNKDENMLKQSEAAWKIRPDKTQPWFGQIQIQGGKEKSYRYLDAGKKLAKEAIPPPPYFPDTPTQRQAWTAHFNANRNMDARLEGILNQLKKDGESENTIIFFFSDHGSNNSLRHKQYCYEGGMHVPLIIKGKHTNIKSDTKRTDLVSLLDVSATTLALGQATLPPYLAGENLFSEDYKKQHAVFGARDRCDYTIDRIRTVRTNLFRYIRNDFPNRHRLQAGYRDDWEIVKDLKRLRTENKLSPFQKRHWFGARIKEELYDVTNDPHQLKNLAHDPQFKPELERHRALVLQWEKEYDRGTYPEPFDSLRGTFDLWKDIKKFKEANTNPEFIPFR